jgi:Tfp pilus assembly protein PilF
MGPGRQLHPGGVTAMIIEAPPRHFEALNSLGIMTAQAQDFHRAVQLFDQAIEIDPDRAAVHCNRGLALQELRHWEAALASYDRAIALQVDFAEAYFNRGNLLKEIGQWEAALKNYDHAIALRVDFADAYANRGVVLNDLKQLDAALASYDRAIALEPGDVMAYCNKSFTLLLKGDFARGWPLYEWRWKLGAAGSEAARVAAPLWLGGEDLAGKTILLRAEQGLGDTLQFCRYVKPMADLGAWVILEVQAPLVNLLADLEGVAQLVTQGGSSENALPKVDYYCPLMSLPLACKTCLDTIPASTPYLKSDAAKVADWRVRLGAHTAPRIGLVWSGSATNKNDRHRSLPLAELIRHLPEEFHYVSLQKDLRPADAETLRATPALLNPVDELYDFSDTAALCECLDLVISVDTSVAHLSAALGRPTWILLPFSPAWRWLLNRDDSPWYGSVKLFRQDARGDWHGVLQRMAAHLRQSFSVRELAHVAR